MQKLADQLFVIHKSNSYTITIRFILHCSIILIIDRKKKKMKFLFA